MRSLSLLAVCLLAFFTAALGAKKEHEWQTGKVLDMNRNAYLVGHYNNSHGYGTAQANGNYGTYQGTRYGSETDVYHVYETFVIEGNTYTYVAQERLRWRWSKPANLTVNAPVKFAVEKRKLFVVDDDGKEHEMTIIKRILKQPTK